ncbi:MAG: penicillin-binding transpeptidase domain-containing protein, partial [Deltaproteobacteria bacterium]
NNREMRKKNPGSYSRRRIFFVIGCFIAVFAAISFRAFQLQVLHGKQLKKLAARQHRKTINIQSKRGDIHDRNSKELAVSVEVDSVYVYSDKIGSYREAAKELAPALSMDRRELERKIRGAGGFVWLKRTVELTKAQREVIAGVEGAGLMKESRRYYPNRQLAANLVGFTGIDENGLEGVERHYDDMLKGESRKFVSDKDARGRTLLFEDLDKTAPVKGMEVGLTIDKTIQYVTEKALKKAVDDSGAKGGTAIVMDPHTGEVLGMASLPTFDPNDVGSFSPRQWRNRAITDTYEPGSVFKLFLVSAALEENTVKPQDSVFCENGSYRVADRVFHDHEGYGWLTVSQVIKFSSNIGSAKIGERLGRAQLYRYLKAFGFGGKTGIDLPGEVSGSLRHYGSWSSVTLETVSFGQGVSATGIQLVSALSSIANGGFLMKPYVVKSIKDSSGRVISETNPVVVRRVVSEDTAKKLTEMLITVTHDGGTGEKAAIEDFEVAGKTGTAQKPDFKHGGYERGAFVASFFGFVPARAPRLAIIVTIDEPKGDHFGGVVAAPAFRDIARQSLAYLGVFKENPVNGRVARLVRVKKGIKDISKADGAGKAEDAKPVDTERPMSVPDFRGKTMRTVVRMARGRAFDVDMQGNGRAVGQKPTPGQNIPEKGPVVVWFQ